VLLLAVVAEQSDALPIAMLQPPVVLEV